MYNRTSPVNFNGYWTIGSKTYTKIKPDDGAKIIVNELIYHPFSGESRKFINAEMNKIRSGWCYDALEQHPYYGKDRAQGI